MVSNTMHLDTAPAELAQKAHRVRTAAATRGAEAVLLTSSTALAWLLDGARLSVPVGGPPVAQAVVHPAGVTLWVHANEAERLLGEEVGPRVARALDLDAVSVPWHQPLSDAVGPLDALPWRTVGEAGLASELQAARAALLPTEELRYRRLCSHAARVVTDVLREVDPDTTEREVAAALTAAAVPEGSEVLVALVAGEHRLAYRHPLPTDSPLGSRAMVVVCLRRNGMIANLTRWVAFAPSSAALAQRERAIAQVEADVLDVLAPGLPLSQLLDQIRAAYPRHGFDADEWERHHQGGPTGYAGRDPRLVPGVAGRLMSRQALALNPTAPGVKIEDTVLLTDGGVEVLTADPRWPAETIRGRARPVALQRY